MFSSPDRYCTVLQLSTVRRCNPNLGTMTWRCTVSLWTVNSLVHRAKMQLKTTAYHDASRIPGSPDMLHMAVVPNSKKVEFQLVDST